MKKCTFLFLLLVASVWQLRAQDSIFVASPPSQMYITNLTLFHPDRFSQPVTIISVRDSSIILSPLITGEGYFPVLLPLTEVYAFEIEKIRIHRKNRLIIGMLNGALVGLALGAISGLAAGSDPEGSIVGLTAGGKALFRGALGMVLGGAAGGVVGPFLSVNIPIYGRMDAFSKNKSRLEKYQLP